MERRRHDDVERILTNLDAIDQRAQPSSDFLDRLEQNLLVRPNVKRLPKRIVWLAAASFAALVTLNVAIASQHADSTVNVSHDIDDYDAFLESYDILSSSYLQPDAL